jgi:DNA polymerase III alpha subunit (gram-positive type)
MKALVFDMEANGLLPEVTEAFCFVGKELNGDSVVQLVSSKEIYGTVSTILSKYNTIIGHNIIGYDIPLLRKLYNINDLYETHKVIDTLVLSTVLFPDRVGGHSVEAWAERFGDAKVGNDDWTEYTPVMLERCHSDVRITEKIYNRCIEESKR